MGGRRRRLPFSIRICIYTAGWAKEEILFAMPGTPQNNMENRYQHGGGPAAPTPKKSELSWGMFV